MKEKITKGYEKLLFLIFPRRCPVCDEVLPLIHADLPRYVCPQWRKKLPYVLEPFCRKCGKPVESRRQEYCMNCAGKKHEFKEGRAVFVYRGVMKTTMYRFKYSNRREYAEFFGEEAQSRLAAWLARKRPDVIMPVPMYRKKKKQRGYNQAEDFAVQLGKITGIPVDRKSVIRVRETVPMKGLSEKERRENMKNAFHIKENIVEYKRILIVDDIYTTGSTIDSMAKEIKKYCDAEILFLCVCTGSNV